MIESTVIYRSIEARKDTYLQNLFLCIPKYSRIIFVHRSKISREEVLWTA